MSGKPLTIDERLEKLDAQLERIATAVVKGFGEAKQDQQAIRDEVKQSIDIHARAVDA
jgi:hypothetical protein